MQNEEALIIGLNTKLGALAKEFGPDSPRAEWLKIGTLKGKILEGDATFQGLMTDDLKVIALDDDKSLLTNPRVRDALSFNLGVDIWGPLDTDLEKRVKERPIRIFSDYSMPFPVMRQSDEEFWANMFMRSVLDTPPRAMVLRKMKKPIPHRSGSGRKNARRIKWLIGATRKVPA